MGDGPEHDLGHLGPIARSVGMTDRVRALADRTQAMLDRGDWPDRAAASPATTWPASTPSAATSTRHGRSSARSCPATRSCASLAPTDDDLIALRDEIPTLSGL